MADPRVSGASPVNPQSLRNLEKAAEAEEIMQVASEADLEQWCELDAFNPMAMMRQFRPLSEMRQGREAKAEEKAKVEEKKILAIEEIDEIAGRYQHKNYELQAKTLVILRALIKPGDSPDEILRKILEIYPDPSLADEALDFLIETAADDPMRALLTQAKEQLNNRMQRQIRSGRNMGAQAREFSKEGLGPPTQLRDLYRDITGTARDPVKLFDELSDKYPFNKLKIVINFLLHSLGADLRAKGPSITRPELKRLIDETRSLQGILGIYRFFKSRMGLIHRQFTSYEISMPTRLEFDSISKQFVKFLSERFMSPDRILQSARQLGISEEAMAQVIVFTQMRDAIKQISPRYYRTNQQREELLASFLKAIEQLEDKIEEEEEKEREQEEEKKRKKRAK